jgi:hypothetical protein
MCDCIQKIETQINSNNYALWANVEKQGWCSISYLPICKNGNLAKHHRYKGKDWKYCPFCGESFFLKT